MIKAPLTLLYDFEHLDDRARRTVMHEFAVNGCTNLVLTDTLISQIMKSPYLLADIRNEAKEEGITWVDAHSPFGPRIDLQVIDEAEHRMAMLRHSLSLEICAQFGVKTITIHAGNGEYAYPGYAFEQYQQSIIRSLKELLPLAEKLDIIMCIENIWTDVTTPESLMYIVNEVNSPYVGICYDAGHANLMARDRGFEDSAPIGTFVKKQNKPIPYNDHILEMMLPQVVNCHLHDNNGQYDEHTLPGRGDVDWKHIMGLLAKAPRLKAVQSEVIPVRQNISIRELCETFQKLMTY